MADKYGSFEELVRNEDALAYKITFVPRASAVALIAPHGGKIEAGTSEICRAVAGEDLTFYLFEGARSAGNRELHITSTKFDEPRGLEAAASAQVVITIHGQAGEDEFINVGGRHQILGQTIIEHFADANYQVGRLDDLHLQGLSADNICNRGASGLGVQLELSRALRDRLVAKHRELAEFARILRQAMVQHEL